MLRMTSQSAEEHSASGVEEAVAGLRIINSFVQSVQKNIFFPELHEPIGWH